MLIQFSKELKEEKKILTRPLSFNIFKNHG